MKKFSPVASYLTQTVLTTLALTALGQAAPDTARVSLQGHLNPALATAHVLSPLSTSTPIALAFTLKLRNTPELTDLLSRLHNPNDSLYGQYLTPAQFTDRFGPTQADYNAVIAYARSQGLAVTGTSPNRLVLNVSGTAGQIGSAFGVRLSHYAAKDGRQFFSADSAPSLPREIAGRLNGIFGLDNAAQWRSSAYAMPAELAPSLSPRQIGSGPGGGMTPNDIKTAYSLVASSPNGSGQVLGLFQLDGYTLSDIRAYQAAFGLPSIPLQNVLMDGFSGAAGNGSIEVSLDIELQSALAPGVSKIMVYEGPNSASGVIDTYNKIATDNIAKQISTSWGLPESYSYPAMLNAESAIFSQMAAQGQTIYAAAGDSGAYDDGKTLSVDDPASQPFVTGVGGTTLALNADKTYHTESVWNHGIGNGGGGGGISGYWTKPDYQAGLGVSAANRNVPDVSLDADPSTGYVIAWRGGWYLVGGTSCAAPLWAAFTALVNQQRAQNGSATLGFANPALYQIGRGIGGKVDFHDIADGSTNMYYASAAGYDNATGWGSFNGASLLADLAPTSGGVNAPVAPPSPPAPIVPSTPTGLTAAKDNGKVNLSWASVSGASTYNLYRATASGGEGNVPFKTGLTAITFADTAVVNNTRYFYKVASVNSGGISALSAEVSALPQAPAQIASLTLSTGLTGNGISVTGTITLAAPAPADGAIITLASSNSSVTVPATVTIASGASSGTFTITTKSVGDPAIATISATLNSVVKTATLNLAPTMSAVALSTTNLVGGGQLLGVVVLGYPAPTGGIVIALTSSNSAAASFPATASVPAGQMSMIFPIKTNSVAVNTAVTITATAGSQTRSAQFTIQAPILASVVIAPGTITGGASTTGTVTLSSPAPIGGISIALIPSVTSVTVPKTITIPVGALSASFPVTTRTVTSSTSTVVSAALNGTKTAALTLLPVAITTTVKKP